MPIFNSRPVPEGLESYFRERLVSEGDCIKWSGLKALPTGSLGVEMPMAEWDGKLWRVAPLAWAIAHREEYPETWYQNTCGDKECVRPSHVKIISPRRAGRKSVALEETADYESRYILIKEWLTQEPNTVMFEIMSRLRDNGVGGKNVTVSKIVHRVREELNLPGRVPSRRKAL